MELRALFARQVGVGDNKGDGDSLMAAQTALRKRLAGRNDDGSGCAMGPTGNETGGHSLCSNRRLPTYLLTSACTGCRPPDFSLRHKQRAGSIWHTALSNQGYQTPGYTSIENHLANSSYSHRLYIKALRVPKHRMREGSWNIGTLMGVPCQMSNLRNDRALLC